jgi:hypothetical protein
MSRVIEVTLYQFDELSDKAKEKARDWYRDGQFDYDWWDSTYEDAVECARRMGLTVKTSTETYSIIGKPGTRTRERTNIFFTGFSSQGDGACFEGTYAPVADPVAAIKDHAPVDEKLHSIAADLAAVNALSKGYLRASIQHSGHYYHAYSMDFDFEWDEAADGADGESPLLSDEAREQAEKDLREALIDFANWIYRQLEKEHDYLSSDENVDETIRINEYEFHADGSRA